jgi:hypothetical protein
MGVGELDIIGKFVTFIVSITADFISSSPRSTVPINAKVKPG